MSLEKAPSENLKNFFLGLIAKSFDQVGVGDQQIVDYMASMLADFSRAERWLMIRNAEGRRLASVVEMLASQLGSDSQRRAMGERALRKYVGDYTLFMSGLFRPHVERGGYLSYYLEEGKRSYKAVSVLDVSLYRPGFLIFEQLSDRFEQYSGALDYTRKCFFAAAPGHSPFSDFLSHIRGWTRIGLSDN
jgi:hypothetical protein